MQRLISLMGFDLAVDDDGTYILMEDGTVRDVSTDWRPVLTALFGVAELRAYRRLERYDMDKKERSLLHGKNQYRDS